MFLLWQVLQVTVWREDSASSKKYYFTGRKKMHIKIAELVVSIVGAIAEFVRKMDSDD